MNDNIETIKEILRNFIDKEIKYKDDFLDYIDFFIEICNICEKNAEGLKRASLDREGSDTNVVHCYNDILNKRISFFENLKKAIHSSLLETTGRSIDEIRSVIVSNNQNPEKLSKDLKNVSFITIDTIDSMKRNLVA